PGDVLVVALSSPAIHGMFGDLLAASVMARGCRGLVIDSAVRDIAELNRMGFPIWSRAIHAQGTVKETAGAVNMPVEFGGITVHPGDVIVADDDGVVVVGRTSAGPVADASDERVIKEETSRSRLEAGDLGLDLYGLRDKLIDLGVTWVDSADEI
ncbi:MAG: 4-carboxy-4-hydroxy-2-oxoadipate aldolase/oxaloacetate decarboxylase, partial [Acidimicrobiia bacterium]|nr:4-carboxy-4-hydroxy-2-oxoadipate aldolase/oxaloacetate decarboxylase [Acidimicrobiia bacterium]